MYEIKETKLFDKWFANLKDEKTKIIIMQRIKRMSHGNFGDFKMINSKISELRISFGAGYRVYFTIKGKEIILLLIGGDKSSQNKDISKAKEILKELKDE